MKSEYTQAFDELAADGKTINERTERLISRKYENETTTKIIADKPKKRFFGKRSVAILTAAVLAVAVCIPIGLHFFNGGGMLKAMAQLKDTYVDMNGVAAFGVWNAPDTTISDVSYINAPASFTSATDDNGIISGDWSDDERYDWESDFDWDPTKSNVLIAINEDGTIDEVIYERTNGRGQVRQDTLGNAAMVYVSEGFTYVMYVNDQEWEFWKEINFAQEMRSPNGFHCHHESMQTIVIHNETGKVFPLKDLIPQVNELSGATNYTMQVIPHKNDFLSVCPMYGIQDPLWFSVNYDEANEKIYYEYVLPIEYRQGIAAARRDKYGQFYLLLGSQYEYAPAYAGIVNLPSYMRYGNSIAFYTKNGVMLGTDGRAYTFDGGKLKVFGENFELAPVEEGLQVAFEGIACDFLGGRDGGGNNGISYKLKNGYLCSMFGEVWKVDSDGNLHAFERLEGSFPKFADDGYLIGGEIIAFVDTEPNNYGNDSINGRLVKISFNCSEDKPQVIIDHIMNANEMDFHCNRLVVVQNQNPDTLYCGETKYFLITVQDGKPQVDYFAYGKDGSILGLTQPIIEPLKL